MQDFEWIHEPIKIRYGVIKTPRKSINISTCYRVYTSFTIKDEIDKREDILCPSFKVDKGLTTKSRGQVKKIPCIRLFYAGAEKELDRYLLWLHKVYLKCENDAPAPIYVAKQDSHRAQTDLTDLYPEIATIFIGPNELEHYGLLVSPAVDPLPEELF